MKRFFSFLMLSVSVGALVSCEHDYTDVGSGLVNDGSSADVYSSDVVSYNTYFDSIRSDQKMLQNGVLGVYDEPVFGKTKARFISQLRLEKLAPSFEADSRLDSVVLFLPVYTKSEVVSTDTIYIYKSPEENGVDTLMITKRLALDSIYGNTKSKMKLQVREVASFLYSTDTMYFSNPLLRERDNISVYPTILGEKEMSSEIETKTIKLSNVQTNIYADEIGYKIYLDKNFFQSKILDQSSANLSDQASFIRNVIRGLEFSVQEEQGYFFNFNPEKLTLKVYYSYKKPAKVETRNEERLTSSVNLTFSSYWGGGYNVQINQFQRKLGGEYASAINAANPKTGDKRIYLNGMDGGRAVVQLNLDELKTKVKENNWAIVNAELRFYIDKTNEFTKPPFLFAWNQYTDEKGKRKNELFSDVTAFINYYPQLVQFNPKYNYEKKPEYYAIHITDFVKDIIEKDKVFTEQKVIVGLGNFLLSEGRVQNKNPFFNNRAYNPHRIVLHGNATEATDKKLKLLVQYTKK